MFSQSVTTGSNSQLEVTKEELQDFHAFKSGKKGDEERIAAALAEQKVTPVPPFVFPPNPITLNIPPNPIALTLSH